MKTKKRNVAQQFSIQTGSVNITVYQQEEELPKDMLKRAFESFSLVKKADTKLGLGLLGRPQASQPSAPKPVWKPGDLDPKCPQCGGEMNKIDGKYGPFWSCLNYKTTGCKGTVKILEQKGERVSEDELDAMLDDIIA